MTLTVALVQKIYQRESQLGVNGLMQLSIHRDIDEPDQPNLLDRGKSIASVIGRLTVES